MCKQHYRRAAKAKAICTYLTNLKLFYVIISVRKKSSIFFSSRDTLT